MSHTQPIFDDIQAIAFDLDGTLVDSVPGLAKATQLMLTDLNLPLVSEAQVKNWVGNGVDKLIERALISVNAPLSYQAEAKLLFNAHYDKTIDEGTQLFPGVKETMQKLQDNGYPMTLVTNKPAKFLPDLLDSLGIRHYFSLCLGDGDVIKLKPHPAPLFLVMATLGLYQDQLLFIGDSRNDMLAAKNAHCPTIALSYGYNYGEPITTSHPDIICDRFADILTHLSLPRTIAKK
ncbi:phosphoglycolate phosphatase [Utexia brackfieldae]|uniref:phosphoglycolate phosphatase n=1 Tax=Utexia brackfieldae TaxID=3074108 RepID=UPI00370D3BF1